MLFQRYSEELGIDLAFQNFSAELANIGGVYEAVLIAGPASAAAGCVALKRHDASRCEMKRLYVRPEARGDGLGRRLADAALTEARARFYREMVLDTLMRLGPAVAMYEDLGFRRCAPYYENPEPDVVYMRLEL